MPEQVRNCIKLLDIDLRRDMFFNIVLSGGTTLFPGFPERLQAELVRTAPGKCQPRVLLPKDRRWVLADLYFLRCSSLHFSAKP